MKSLKGKLMTGKPEMYHLTWQEIEDAAQTLSDKIKDLNLKGIIAVSRGGLVPSALVAQMLPCRNVHVVSMATYDGKTQRQTAEFFAEVEGDGEGMVVIDDLSDTGKSYRILREKYPKAHFATLFIKPEGEQFVDVYAKAFPQDMWLVFPWERD